MADAHCEHRLRRPERMTAKVPSLYMCSASLTSATLAHAAVRASFAVWLWRASWWSAEVDADV